MIGVTTLLTGRRESGVFEYRGEQGKRAPVVVWNCTRRCNLRCIECHSESDDREFEGELTTTEALRLLDDLALSGVSVVLFSGGEPLMRHDLFDLLEHARRIGIRPVISTNGTMITSAVAKTLGKLGVSYVSIAIDGVGAVHDAMRGGAGAFASLVDGIRNTRAAGIPVGLRFTLRRQNRNELPAVLDFCEKEGVAQIAIHHLAYDASAPRACAFDLTHEETRAAVNYVADRVLEWQRRGVATEVLTIGNDADAVVLVERVLDEKPERAAEVIELLRKRGGNEAGEMVCAINWDGVVYPDQFWRTRPLGNVRQQTFSAIWNDPKQELLSALRDRERHLTGRCRLCQWLSICNGNVRERAEAVGNLWGDDPACYLTDNEVGLGGQPAD